MLSDHHPHAAFVALSQLVCGHSAAYAALTQTAVEPSHVLHANGERLRIGSARSTHYTYIPA